MARQERIERHFERIAFDQIERRVRAQRALAQPLRQQGVHLDGPNPGRRLDQPARQEAQTRADLENLILPGRFEQAEDRFEDGIVDEKMLAEFFSRSEVELSQRRARLLVERNHNARYSCIGY